MLASNGIPHTLQCHAGSGICLINLFMDGLFMDGLLMEGNGAPASEKTVSVVGELLDRAVGANGNLVVQAAPPELKPRLPVWGAPRGDFPVMARIKNRLDPAGIMSPGRFVGKL
jgi:hypothetical protein